MKRIQRLEANISNKIAAGEVVERPAAVVKELVENAIDAGASKITIEIKKAGKELIRVTDNGAGIEPNDVHLAFERHATSKIETVDDIYRVATLGFRGEALASICAVSNMDVITRQKDKETGIKLSMSGGRKLSEDETGCPIGTTMVVKDLFFNTPARLKFLKSDNAEVSAISDIVNKLALSHSEIGFRYVVNDKNMFNTPGKGDLFKSIYAVYEKEMTRNLIPIDKSENGLRITGFMTNLQYTRGNRSMQNFFVNGRYIKSPVLTDGLSMAYRTMLTPGRFPACFIMVELDHTKVDVNIHPAKTEIKFHQEGIVKQIVYTAVRETLLSYNQTPVVEINDDKLFRKVVMEEDSKNKKDTQVQGALQDGVGGLSNRPTQSESVLISKSNERTKSVTSYNVETAKKTLGSSAPVPKADSNEMPIQDTVRNHPVYSDESTTEKKSEQITEQSTEQIPDQNFREQANVHSNDQYIKQSKDRSNFESIKEVDSPASSSNHSEVPSKSDSLDKVKSTNYTQSSHKKVHQPQSFMRPSVAENTGFTYKDVAPKTLVRESTVSDPFQRLDNSQDAALEDIAVTKEIIKHKAEIYQGLRYIGQMFMTYLLFEKEGRMYLIDQHAAHEKILYEHLLVQYRKSALDRQILLDPVLIELSYADHTNVMAQAKEYEKLGLALDDFGGNTVVIREIPALLDRSGAEALFRKAADRLRHDNTESVSPTSEKLEKIMQESCKTAIKAHDHMADIEVDTLLDQLSTLDDPYTCPHGRPIIISITKSEIEKKFKRT